MYEINSDTTHRTATLAASLLVQSISESESYSRTTKVLDRSLLTPVPQTPPNLPVTAPSTVPGNLLASVLSAASYRRLLSALRSSLSSGSQSRVTALADGHLSLSFRVVSELNSPGASFCGLFWDPHANFVVVAFRGTDPTTYAEWETNFTCQMSGAEMWMSGFGRCE